MALICIFLSCINAIYAEVIISEVELNPAGEDRGNEWIELYSSEEVDLNDWKLISSNGRNFSLNFSFSGYSSFVTSNNFLTNEKNTLKLINKNSEKIFETEELSDSSNNDKTWQYCGEWVFSEASRNKENNCPQEKEEPQDDEEIQSHQDEEKEKEKLDGNLENGIIENEELADENEEITTESIIILNTKNNPEDNRIIYKSRKEYIKEYSIYFFIVFSLLLVFVLIVIRIIKI